jgi:hypothetical protein
MKMLLAAAGFALLTAGSGSGYVEASNTSGSYYYIYTYFSDASRTTVVGYNNQSCNPFTGQVSDNVSGTQTPYFSQSILGYCSPGGDQPL